MPLSRKFTILDGTNEYLLPEWAASLLWLGEWCRNYRDPLSRLVAFAVLPTRDLAAAFAGIGAILGGAKSFKDTLSWPRFRALTVGTNVFWQSVGGEAKFAGTIISFSEIDGTDFISIKLTKPLAIAKKGLVQSISKDYFDAYSFTLDKPPAEARTYSLNNAARFINGVRDGINPKWIGADGVEGLIVTNEDNFDETISGLSLGSAALQPIRIVELLCLGKTGTQSHAKLKISHPKGEISGLYPLVILDGREAFEIHEHLENSSNLLVILARSEYTAEIDDRVRQLRNVANGTALLHLENFPKQFPTGVELGAYLVRRS